MFERQILAKLEQWKTSSRRKPLILRGARQVGKTTVVNQFGKQFDNYLYFNMEMAENVRMFEMAIPLDDLVDMLFASQGRHEPLAIPSYSSMKSRIRLRPSGCSDISTSGAPTSMS